MKHFLCRSEHLHHPEHGHLILCSRFGRLIGGHLTDLDGLTQDLTPEQVRFYLRALISPGAEETVNE